MKDTTLEERYEQLMKDASFYHDYNEQKQDEDRFKSILHPDYSEYTTSTVTGSTC